MHRTARFDFLENPSGGGYVVVINGRRVNDVFSTLGEVLAFAQTLGTPARFSGRDIGRVTAEGGRIQAGDENIVG
jgi:hypothetical protein